MRVWACPSVGALGNHIVAGSRDELEQRVRAVVGNQEQWVLDGVLASAVEFDICALRDSGVTADATCLAALLATAREADPDLYARMRGALFPGEMLDGFETET